MSHKIDYQKCIDCGTCAASCPQKAIKEEKNKYRVDPKLCNDCGSCEKVCPQEAIKKEA